MPSALPAPSAAVQKDGQRASLSLSLSGGPAQARQNLLPSRGRPRLSSHIGRLCSLQRAASSGHRHPLHSRSEEPQSRIPTAQQSRSPPRSVGHMPHAHPHWAPVSATRICGWGTPLSRLPSPGVSVTWPRGLGHVGHGCTRPPPGIHGPAAWGGGGGPGNASPRAVLSLRSLWRPLQQPASQPAEVLRSSRLLPASAPFAAPRPQRPRAARRQTEPGSSGELQLGPSPFPSLIGHSHQPNPSQTE